jgi:hypothetical protein
MSLRIATLSIMLLALLLSPALAQQRPRSVARYLVMSVHDDQGRPLAGALIVLVIEGQTRSNRTDSNGFAILEGNFVIGDMVHLTVTAPGFLGQERNAIIGSMQRDSDAMRVPNGLTNPTATDYVGFRLKRAPAEPMLVVEVLRSSDNQPIRGAYVIVQRTGGGGQTVADSYGHTAFGTDGAGCTQPIPMPQTKGAAWRIKVDCVGYEKKWSDLPEEMISPGPPRRYVVYLKQKNLAPKAGYGRNVTGQWDCLIGSTLSRSLTLTQTGSHVEGKYKDGYRIGTLSGELSKTKENRWFIEFTYNEEFTDAKGKRQQSGKGEFEVLVNQLAGYYVEPDRYGTHVNWGARRHGTP